VLQDRQIDRSKFPQINQKEKYSIKTIFYKNVDTFFVGPEYSIVRLPKGAVFGNIMKDITDPQR